MEEDIFMINIAIKVRLYKNKILNREIKAIKYYYYFCNPS